MKVLKSILFVLIVLSLLPVAAQDVSLDKKLPMDPSVRKGKLKNGLTYYIKRNEKPENRVELRLAVNAGSVLETDEQQGLAHFLEHMAFNGTKNFEKNELVSYLQSVGVRFGSHLNAYTSFDETVYILPIPSDSAEILAKGLQILEDWAHNILLTEEEIDKERGVVLEELRIGQGPDQRMREKFMPKLFKDSRYAERLPIGKREVIENFQPETIRAFYRDWYRPDMMAIIAVGDIDVDQMEKMIKKQFSKIKSPKKPKPRPSFEVPDHSETLVSIATDREAPFTQVRLYYKTDRAPEATLGDYRQMVVRQLYGSMINQRLNELRQKADPPFISGFSYYGQMWARTKDAYQSFASTPEGEAERGLRAILEENERVRRHGFTEGELERAKISMLSSLERAYNERNTTESRSFASEYINNFLDGEPIPGIEWEFNFTKEILPGIALKEVNQLAQKWIREDNRVVVITAPEKEGVRLPTEEEILAILDFVEQEDLEPYEDMLASTELMETLPTPGKVQSEKNLDGLGVTELTLSNGVRVVLKPTDFKADEILMSAYSPGGHSLYPDEDLQSARNADAIIQNAGIGDFSPTDLQKLFAGKNFSAVPYISELTEGFTGRATPRDLETMLQVVHMYFTAPREDKESFQSFITKNKATYRNVLANPRYYYSDRMSRILTQDHPRGGGFPTEEDWNKVDFQRVYEIYRDRFADAGDFTFFFVGNFQIDEIRPVLEQYLGSLPTNKRQENWKDHGVRPPQGPLKENVVKGMDPQSIVSIYYFKEAPYDRLKAYHFSSFSEVLNIKLIEELREEKGGVYSVSSSASASKYPYGNYTFRIYFPCAPENVDKLTETALKLVKELKQNGPSDTDLQKVKEAQRRQYLENLKNNNYWLTSLRNFYYHDLDPLRILETEKIISGLSKDDIKRVANELIDLDKYVKIALFPEDYQQ
jgi:zinc protease